MLLLCYMTSFVLEPSITFFMSCYHVTVPIVTITCDFYYYYSAIYYTERKGRP